MIQFAHAGIRTFHGRSIAEDLQFTHGGKPVLTAHLESVDLLNTMNEVDFAPPPDATPVPRRVTLSAGISTGLLLKHDNPAYPRGARGSGTVVLRILIDKGGKVAEVHFIGGPPDFKDSAIDAAHKWRYKPFLVDDEPVEVDTTANLVFSR